MRAGMSALLVLVLSVPVFGQSIVTEMTPQLIEEAIKAGERGKVASGNMSERSGWSWGSLHIATFSTPFMRVAAAAERAKKEYRKFTPAEVTPEMTAPELHVYAWSNVPDTVATNVTAVVITPKKGNRDEQMAKAIHPTRFEPIPQQFQNLFGAETTGNARLAVFPLSALSEDNEVHVVYDRDAKIGGNAAGGVNCDDCKAGFKLKGVR